MSYPIYYVEAGDTLPILFDTFDGGTGASITLTGLAVTDIEIYKDGSATQRASDAGYTLLDTDGIDFDTITGIHGFSIDLSDNSDAGFYAVGSWYHVVVSSVTIDAQTVNFVAAAFRIVSATRGMAGTALPDAAADAAGGLPISDAGGLDMDAILTDTNSLNDTKVPDTISLANINAQVDTALADIGLDHMVSAAVVGADITDNSIIAQMVSKSATADWDSFDNTVDSMEAHNDGIVSTLAGMTTTINTISSKLGSFTASGVNTVLGFFQALMRSDASDPSDLGGTYAAASDSNQAIRDRGDAAWTTGGNGPQILQSTTIATLASQTSFTLTAGSADDDAYNRALIVVTDSATSTQKAVGRISDYTGSTKTVTLAADPAIFTMAVGDTVDIIAVLQIDTANGRADANLEAINGTTGSVTNLENDYSTSVGYNKAWSTINTVTNVTSDVTANMTSISGDAVAANNLEAMLDGTGGVTIDADLNGSIASLGTTAKAEINTEVDTALTDIGLDHLLGAAVIGTDITDDSVIAQLVSASATADWDDFDNTTDSLQAIRDRGDAAWTTGGGGSSSELLQNTTIATLASQVSFTLTAGSADNDAYNGAIIIVTDSATSTQKAVGRISDYVGSTKTVTLESDPGIFTMAVGDTVDVIASLSDLTEARIAYLDNINGHTAQTGDSFARLGAPAGASVSADIATVDSNVDAILVDTADMQPKLGTPAGADMSADIAAVQADTDDIQTRLPAALVSGKMDADATAISGSTAAADNLEASAEIIITGTAQTGTLSTTQMTSDLSEATDDHYIGRVVIWTSGNLLGQASDITDYQGSNGMLTYTAVTEAPANTDTFVIV